jgi:hypothetical protein
MANRPKAAIQTLHQRLKAVRMQDALETAAAPVRLPP